MLLKLPTVIQSHLEANPVISRVMGQRARLTVVRRILWIAALILSISSMRSRNSELASWIVLVSIVLTVVNPILACWTAAAVTCQQINSENYESLYLTAISNSKLLESYLFSALYRLQFPLGLMVTLAPPLATRLPFILDNNQPCSSSLQAICPPITVLQVFDWPLIAFMMLLATIGIVCLGIVVGTTLALWWRNRYFAGGAASLLLSTLIVCSIVWLNSLPLDYYPEWVLNSALLFSLSLYAAAFAVACISRRIARPGPLNYSPAS